MAIQIFKHYEFGEREVMRHVVCYCPCVVQLLDVMRVASKGRNLLGLAFENYDLDLRRLF